VAVGHNGNLVNADVLRAELEAAGSIFTSSSDTEVIVHLIARSKVSGAPGSPGQLVASVREALGRVAGAYSLVFLTPTALVGVRDPMGFRPLVLGQLKGQWVLASETTALDLIEAEYIREVEPGELVVIDRDGLRSEKLFPDQAAPARQGRCIFESIYFARPDSILFGRSVYETRHAYGKRLAIEHPVPADLVIPVPDSGVPAAIGYAEQSGIPFNMGLVRSHYVGRTFIEPSQQIRHFGVKLKLNALKNVLKGKRVVVVDDSIVRGTTSRKIVKMIRAAGASEVHLRISSPPTAWPCYYGIDTPTRQELIASTHDELQIATYVTADSLGYLSLTGMYQAIGEKRENYCDACFSGEYLIDFPARPAVPRGRRVVGT
jgi:amidophosphoribosyltransferase